MLPWAGEEASSGAGEGRCRSERPEAVVEPHRPGGRREKRPECRARWTLPLRLLSPTVRVIASETVLTSVEAKPPETTWLFLTFNDMTQHGAPNRVKYFIIRPGVSFKNSFDVS